MLKQRLLLVAFLLLSGCMLVYHDVVAQGGTKRFTVTEALSQVTKTYGTQFVYDPDVLKNKTTTFPLDNLKGKNVEEVLKGVLYPNNLVFLYVRKNYYTIVPRERLGEVPAKQPEPEKEKRESQTISNTATRVLSGVVFAESGGPVAGATVSAQKTGKVTQTDAKGAFSISVDDNDILVITNIGFKDQEIQVAGQQSVKVNLQTETKQLEDVVVIGYGTVKRKDLTGAISSVSGKDLASAPVTTAAQALQGRAAGVNIVTASGAPGAGINITVRGGTSITQSTTPLYIVDGFEMSDALTNIDINDIASIDVLKDASAAAIYGARGSNGIILITTKSGKKGKTSVAYNTFFSTEKLADKLSMLSNASDFVKYHYELAELQGKTPQWSNVFDNSKATNEPDFYTGVYSRINSRYAGAGSIDWQEELFGGSALTQSHNVSVSTASERTQVLLSYNNNSQVGLLSNHNMTRNAFRVKVNTELYKGIRLDANTLFSNTSTDGGGAYSAMKDVLLQPIIGGTLFTRDELLHTQTFPDFSGLDSYYDTENPLVENEASTSNKRSRLFTVNAGVEFDFLKDFTWRTAGQYTWTSGKSRSFSDENSRAYLTDPSNTGMNGSIGNSESFRYQITNTLNWNRTFATKHNVQVLLGQEVIYDEAEGNSISLKQFPYPNFGLDDISNATVSDKSVSHSRSGLLSFFARTNYNYAGRYLFTATIRRDGSSKFAQGNKYGVFPSVSGAWRISEENFWKNGDLTNVVNNLKLRAGYGETGNNGIGNNLYTTIINQTDYPINNTQGNPAYVPSSTLGNRDLKWESLQATNIGLDISLFGSRINLTTEYYNNDIGDMLMSAVIPSSTGYSVQYQNVGKMRNRGWEFTLNTTPLRTNNFRWISDFNISFNRSKVVSLEKGLDKKTFAVSNTRAAAVTYYAKVGERLGDMYGYKYIGVYTTDDFNADGTLKEGVVRPATGVPQPGDMKFAADNDTTNQFTRQLVKIGNGTPDFIGGFNNTFIYKGFDLNVFLKFSVGNDVYNGMRQSMSPYALFQNTPVEFNYYRLIDPETGKKATSLARLKELNPDESARTWALNTNNSSQAYFPSSYYVEDGSYLRISQLTLGYTLAKHVAQKVKLTNARIYFTTNNLATFTKYKGYDPEVSAANSNVITTPGYDHSTYPRSRSYVFGLNLTF